jgi:PKD repeat protein
VCNFNGTGSNDPDGSISSYSWNFGDGTTGSGAQVQHTYASKGTRTVALTVTDNNGATSNCSKSVQTGTSGSCP